MRGGRWTLQRGERRRGGVRGVRSVGREGGVRRRRLAACGGLLVVLLQEVLQYAVV